MQGNEDAPWASSAPSGDAIDGGPTTDALSTFLPAIALRCDRLGLSLLAPVPGRE